MGTGSGCQRGLARNFGEYPILGWRVMVGKVGGSKIIWNLVQIIQQTSTKKKDTISWNRKNVLFIKTIALQRGGDHVLCGLRG